MWSNLRSEADGQPGGHQEVAPSSRSLMMMAMRIRPRIDPPWRYTTAEQNHPKVTTGTEIWRTSLKIKHFSHVRLEFVAFISKVN